MQRSLAVALVIGTLACVVVAFTRSRSSPNYDEAPVLRDATVDRAKIQHVLDTEGPSEGYEELARQVANQSPSIQHMAAHVYGKNIYKLEGMQAVAVCDDRFLYGCFHSVIMDAVSDKGLSSIEELEKVCVGMRPDYRYACEHGIGHGIAGMIGYDSDVLEKELALCDAELPDSPPIDGCRGGVFMEQVQRLKHDGIIHPRAFKPEEKWKPCDALAPKNQQGCAYWQPLWWVSSIIPIPKDIKAFSEKMGSWCQDAPGGTSSKEHCLAGIGNVAYTLVGSSTRSTSLVCSAATEDEASIYACQVAAARRFLYTYSQDVALKACDGMRPEQTSSCRDTILKEAHAAVKP